MTDHGSTAPWLGERIADVDGGGYVVKIDWQLGLFWTVPDMNAKNWNDHSTWTEHKIATELPV